MISGKRLKGISFPTKMLLEKSGLGKNKKPKNKPNIIDNIRSFSFKFFL